MIYPPALRRGDAIALIAPAGPLASDADLDAAVERVEALGLRAVRGEHVLGRHGYLAGTDAERAADINAALRDPAVRGIFAVRGGYGTTRLLDLVDYDALRADPKVLLGYSDLTALLNVCTARAGVVTFHGPVIALALGPLERAWLQRAMFSDVPVGTLAVERPCAIRAGRARGRLAGGNLSLMAAMVGTPYEIDCTDAIVFLEEVEEAPYRIDRMLTQLRASASFRRAAGIALGTFSNCDAPEDAAPERRLTYVLADRLVDLGMPVVAGAPIGHEGEQWTLPIGAYATLDAASGTLAIEAATS
ncbi:MAG: LD-carboxypeptidase [Candidatus Eremiobacteraeota bacterium]|nr:LD-carboxypeptidase [Candidatus Eremiobacteraeota bacterium]